MWRFRQRVFGALATALVLTASCEKQPEDIGLNVIPDEDQLGVFYSDTTTLTTFTIREDSIRTDETAASLNILGSYHDPVFGPVSASIYTQVRLSANNPDFGSNPQVDSVVLSLAYNGGYYGEVMKLGGYQTIKAHRLQEDISLDSTYYSNDSVAYASAALATITTRLWPLDSVEVGGETLRPQLRLKLDNSFGDEIINSSSLGDSESFLEEFKGFYITTDNGMQSQGQGGLAYMSLTAAVSKLTLYYHNDTDTNSFDMPINEAARFSAYDHNYAIATDIQNQLNDPSLGQNQVFVQSMAGLKTTIRLPFISDYIDSGMVAINSAELIVPLQEGTYDKYSPPARLLAVKISNEGTAQFIEDQFEGESYYGGTFDGSIPGYRFNIARYMQRLLTGVNPDNGLYLLNSGNAVNGYRAVFNGPADPDNPIRLNLTFTETD